MRWFAHMAEGVAGRWRRMPSVARWTLTLTAVTVVVGLLLGAMTAVSATLLGIGWISLAGWLLKGYDDPARLASMGGTSSSTVVPARHEAPTRVAVDPQIDRGPPIWQGVVDAMTEAAIALDRDGNIVHANAAAGVLFTRLLQLQPLAKSIRHPELHDAVRRAMLEARPMSAELTEWVPAERHLAVMVAPIEGQDRAEAGRSLDVPAVLITVRDLSEQHRAMKIRADFVANASHELRTPLTALRGFIETLQGPARNDRAAQDRFLTIMASQAHRMSRLIDDLLLLGRIEERQHLAPSTVVDLGVIVSEAVELLRPLAETRRADIEWQPPSGAVEVTGDRDELLQVFQNLIQNAIKYGKEGGKIIVTLQWRADRRVEVSVIDDGPGIAPEHLPRLTERFYRVSAAHSRQVGGTGLGLAIVKHIVNRHGGELQIDSTVGKGSTFRIRLACTKIGETCKSE